MHHCTFFWSVKTPLCKKNISEKYVPNFGRKNTITQQYIHVYSCIFMCVSWVRRTCFYDVYYIHVYSCIFMYIHVCILSKTDVFLWCVYYIHVYSCIFMCVSWVRRTCFYDVSIIFMYIHVCILSKTGVFLWCVYYIHVYSCIFMCVSWVRRACFYDVCIIFMYIHVYSCVYLE